MITALVIYLICGVYYVAYELTGARIGRYLLYAIPIGVCIWPVGVYFQIAVLRRRWRRCRR